ncbi:ribosome-inactivating family protein [Streptomyces sp. NPDC089424]|uniref:ribosome-inactivating family protein n=1 Tax=Streptomyces sp. NPDC089424 TaxID=3365917 RepID=UPI003801DF27
MALFVTLATFVLGAPAAKADTGTNRIGHVWMHLDDQPSTQQASQYLGLLQSFQGASAHYWQQGIAATQTSESSLIRMDLNFAGESLWLWFTPEDLYLRGFTNHYGDTWTFNDNDWNLAEHMHRIATDRSPDVGLLPDLTRIRTLHFGSNYNSMAANAGGINRGNLPISYTAVWNAAWQLQYGDSTAMTAQSLLLMIQFTSEAVRFWDVYGLFRGVMEDGTRRIGVPANHQELENHWNQIGRFAQDWYAGRNPRPVNVGPHAGVISNISQVRENLWTILGNPATTSYTGDWWHTEL